MPTYQYACTECGHRFEAVQSFTDESMTTCPECSGQLRKVYGSVGVVFKGSGFYRTDSREKAAAGTVAKGPGDKSADKAPVKAEKSGSEKSGSEKSGSEKKSDTAAKAPAASSTGGSGGGSSSAGKAAAS